MQGYPHGSSRLNMFLGYGDLFTTSLPQHDQGRKAVDYEIYNFPNKVSDQGRIFLHFGGELALRSF